MARAAGARLERARTHVWGLAAIGISLLSAALADSTPHDALRYLDPAVADAEAELALRRRALGPLGRLDASVAARPAVEVGDYRQDPSPPAWSARLFVDATVGVSFDRVARLAERYGLARAEAGVAEARRRGVYAALRTHARVLERQASVARIERRLAAASIDAAQAMAASDGPATGPAGDGAATPGAGTAAATAGAGAALVALRSREVRRLGLETLSLYLDRERAQLTALREDAASFGLVLPAAYEPLRFALPAAALERTSEHRIRRLNVERARADLEQLALYGTVQSLRLSGAYVTGDVSVRTDVGILEARPRAQVSVGYPGGSARWSLGVQATLALSTELARIPELELAVERAEKALADHEAAFERRAARLRAGALLAERELALAERQLTLASAELTAAQGPAGRGRSAGAAGGPQGVRDLERARDDVANAERNLYAAWATYLGQAYAYLEYVDGDWEMRVP